MNNEAVISIFDDLDTSFCEHAALFLCRETEGARIEKTGLFSAKRNRLIAAAAAVLIVVAVLVFGPWPPKHSNSTAEVKPTTRSGISVSRSIAIKELPAGTYSKELTEEDIAPVFKNTTLRELAPFVADVNTGSTKYEAWFSSDGHLLVLKLSWSFKDGNLTVSFEPDTRIPKNSMGFVKPWDKPTMVNGYEVYLCQLTQNIGGSEQVVWPNEYDMFMGKDGLLIHAYCFESVLDDMQALCDRLTQTQIDLSF